MCTTPLLTLHLCKHLMDAGSDGVVPNWFASRQWEMDVASLNRTGYFQEYEIKTSRDDFLADFRIKRSKHRLYQSLCTLRHPLRGEHEFCYVPSQFYFVCPVDLVQLKEVPKYAGLMFFNEDHTFTVKRKAPRVHAGKPDSKMIHKFHRCMAHRLHRYMEKEIENERHD